MTMFIRVINPHRENAGGVYYKNENEKNWKFALKSVLDTYYIQAGHGITIGKLLDDLHRFRGQGYALEYLLGKNQELFDIV